MPSDATVEYGVQVKETLETRWQPPKYYYHLAGGGHIKALQSHLSHKFFLHLDIEDFFGCINRSRVTRNLKNLVSYQSAREIAFQSTVRHPTSSMPKYILPFGFVQSPIIASICLAKSALGNRLNEISKDPSFSVSVYVDDIIVSSDSDRDLNEKLEILSAAAERSQFPLNERKQEGPAPRITAFNIHISQKFLEITAERLNAFEQAYALTSNAHRKNGIRCYIKSVNEEQSGAFE